MALVQAYDAKTGEKVSHLIPEHWFDHPVLGKPYTRKPAKAAEAGSKKEGK